MLFNNKIIPICEEYGFLKKGKILINKVEQEIFRTGPIGALLKEQLRLEWLNHVIINRDFTVVCCENNFLQCYDFTKQLCSDRFPFGIAEIITDETVIRLFYARDNFVQQRDIRFSDFADPMHDAILRCTVFVVPDVATEFFHQWQRQRRMWWRKFSAKPGRYSFTDIRTEEGNGTQKVEILAKYPWGEQLLESLRLNSGSTRYLTDEQLQVKYGRKVVQAHHIVSEISISTMLLNTICDAYDEPLFNGIPRSLFYFHRKIAPYKISIAVSPGKKSVLLELQDLGLYLCRLLRAKHISTLFLPIAGHSMEEQFKLHDQLGVCYNVVINESTLRNGVLNLRSRDTTLKEQVHISELVKYVEQLFKNY